MPKLTNKEHYQRYKKKIKLRAREYYYSHREEILKKRKKYHKNNKQKRIEYNVKYRTKRRRTNLNIRLKDRISKRIWDAVKENCKSKVTIKLLGCSINKLKRYLENQFKPGMNWNNYGFYGWHIDHIIPCAKFDLSKASEQKKCFHYTNLQPLWAEENWSKNGK